MKRIGHLFERIVRFDNLLAAAHNAVRGKKNRQPVAAFYFHLETELLQLERELLSDSYCPRPYRSFWVHEPKQRRICAADIRDRVVHHAIIRVLEPHFEAYFIHDTYACRHGKGTHRAVRRAQTFSRRHRYVLQLDVRKFFASVDHAILKSLLARRFKDRRLLALLAQIIDHPIPDGVPGRGLPIGNLTSQYFATFYLGYLDHFVQDDLGVKGYVRYMDDLLLFGEDKAALHRQLAHVRAFLHDRLKLDLKERAVRLVPAGQGISFLGFRVFPRMVRLQRAGWTRFKHTVRAREQAYRQGRIDERGLVHSVQSLLGHAQQAQTRHLRQQFFQG